MSNVRGDKSLKKQTVTKFITLLLILGINQSAHSEQQRLGEFEDHRYDSPVTSTGAMRATEDTVQSSEIIYGQTNDQSHQGYLSQPQSTKPTAGLIVIHEWWGLNEDIHLMADQIAGLGYASLAVDLYDGQSATKVKDAFQLSTNLSKNEEAALANLQAAYDYLVNEVGVEKVGIIGWCLGGKWSLRGALMLPNQIDATVIYYGSLIDDKERLAT